MRLLCCLDGSNIERISHAVTSFLPSEQLTLGLLYVIDSGPHGDMGLQRERFLRPSKPGPMRRDQMREADESSAQDILAEGLRYFPGADTLRKEGRPEREYPHLFLKTYAPFGPVSGGTVRMVVHYACDRAGIPRVGAHRLRHTVATEVLRAGAPLEEIASLLRHRRHATTVLYAKVDWERLRELARPWPGSLS